MKCFKNKQNGIFIKKSEIFQLIIKAFKLNITIKSRFSKVIFGVGILSSGLPWVITKEFSNLTNNLSNITEDSILHILRELFFLAIFMMSQIIIGCLIDFSVDQDKVRGTYKIREMLLDYKCSVKYKYIENYDNFIERINFASEVAGFQMVGCLTVMGTLLHSILSYLVLVVSLAKESAIMLLVICVSCIPTGIIEMKKHKKKYNHEIESLEEKAFINYYYGICTDDKILPEMRQYKLHDYFKEKWHVKTKKYIEKKKKISCKFLIVNAIDDLVKNLVTGSILVIAYLMLKNNPEKGIGFFVYSFTATQYLQALSIQIVMAIADLISVFPYIRVFFELEHLEKDVEDDNKNRTEERVTIEFRDVDFSYDNKNKVLDNINVKIQDGEKIAIVGANGSGKSTFVNLLCGMREPDTGSILFNGVPREKQHDKNITAIFQDFAKYDATLSYNVSLQHDKDEMSDVKMQELLRVVGFLKEDNQMQLDEEIGVFSENTKNMSGGQWQKIALARTVFNNAPIIILDEPTSALDPKSEANLYENFMKLTSDRTTIIISHRLGISSLVDRILVFDKGKIVEEGSHNELISRGGIYKTMYVSQAEFYT